MLDLIKYIVNQFAEHKDEIEYIVNESDTEVTVTVVLNNDDMGKVIGNHGKIAKALRTIVKSATPRGEKKYTVEIKSKTEGDETTDASSDDGNGENA